MSRILHEDEAARPDLFVWNGPIERDELVRWLTSRGLDLPDDLVELWRETGGGDLFESETILGPHGNPDLADDVDSVNKSHRESGLSEAYLIVHVGLCLTAIRLVDKKWVVLDRRDHSESGEYESFESWYVAVLRSEYADRYGLPSLRTS